MTSLRVKWNEISDRHHGVFERIDHFLFEIGCSGKAIDQFEMNSLSSFVMRQEHWWHCPLRINQWLKSIGNRIVLKAKQRILWKMIGYSLCILDGIYSLDLGKWEGRSPLLLILRRARSRTWRLVNLTDRTRFLNQNRWTIRWTNPRRKSRLLEIAVFRTGSTLGLCPICKRFVSHHCQVRKKSQRLESPRSAASALLYLFSVQLFVWTCEEER